MKVKLPKDEAQDLLDHAPQQWKKVRTFTSRGEPWMELETDPESAKEYLDALVEDGFIKPASIAQRRRHWFGTEIV